MKFIQVFDPALCCASGVCGTEVDQALVTFSADVQWARQAGVTIERFNLAQQPMEFANHAAVKNLLDRSGVSALPAVLVDAELALAGRYPTRDELARWAGVAAPAVSISAATSACCAGSKCC